MVDQVSAGISLAPPDALSRAEPLESSDFSAEVAPYHHHVDVDEWNDIYVVGDVHGCLAQLHDLMDVLDPSDDDLVVFVGDLVRKGPDSREVVEYVRERDNLLSVTGNNEAKLITGTKELPSLDPLMDYLTSLPVVVTWEGGMVVHGGVDPRKPLSDHDIEALQNTRAVPPENGYDGPFWWDFYQGHERVFFGHTPLEDPVHTDHATGLDTGCVYGGALTAYDFYGDEFVSVPGHEHEFRPDRKFI